MTTTNNNATRTSTETGRARGPLTAPTVVAPRGRRRPGLITAGVGLAMLGALVAVSLVTAAGNRTPVVAMARDVPYGSVITAKDLTRAEVSVDPSVETVPATAAASLVGKVAATDLIAGALLAPGQLTTAGPPGPGEVVVPVVLAAKRIPAGGLVAGDRLLIVDTPPADADPPAGVPHTIGVTVARVGAPDLNGATVVDVITREGDGPSVAARAATGRFALVVQARGGTS
jgi:hypothetical protein